MCSVDVRRVAEAVGVPGEVPESLGGIVNPEAEASQGLSVAVTDTVVGEARDFGQLALASESGILGYHDSSHMGPTSGTGMTG